MHHNLIIKDGNTTKVVKEVLVDGIQFVDEAPREGSTNFVTSDGVNKAIGDTKESVDKEVQDLQNQIDEIAEKAGSGYIPKGEATVATLNALSGQENGELYTMTDAGTLTDGSLAVVAGDTVAWDATNSVWYKAMDYAPRQYGTNEVHNLPTTITAFRTGDVIPVDGPSGTAKMSKDDLLRVTAQLPLSKVNAVNDNLLDMAGFIEYNGTYGCPDYSALTDSTISSTVFFQKSKTQKKPSVVTKIKYAVSTNTAEIYKVKVNGSSATETFLFSVGNGVTGVEEYAVNIPLAEDEYIGIKGFFYYKPFVTNTESYATITNGEVGAFTRGILGLSYEGFIDGELPNRVGDLESGLDALNGNLANLKSNFDGFNTIISDVNGKIYKSGGDISKSTTYTSKTTVFWPTSAVPKVKYVTGVKIPSLGNGCSIYKVTVNGTTATSVKLADIPAATEHYDVFVELADNEYIGISDYFKYSNSAGTGYNYYYTDANNEVHQTSGGTVSLEIEGFAKEKDPYNVVVAADGSGDYTTIHDALVGTYGIDTASKPVTIKVKAGIYNEPSMDGSFYPYCHYRHLAIVGENKENTIIRNTNGYYYPNVQDNSCIKVAGNVYIANLTLISLSTNYQDPPDTEYTNRKAAYCVHIDAGASSGDITEVNNCIMYNDHNCCVGIGIKTKQTVKIKNCEMRSNFVDPDGVYGGAVIYAHDDSGGTAGQMDEFLDIVGCIIRSENSGLGIKVLNVYGCDIVCTFVGNALSYLDAGSGCALGAKTYKDKVCSGNNVSSMNY